MAHDQPFLFLEDDISTWNPNTVFDIPDDADILRLGNVTWFRTPDGESVDYIPPNALRKVNSEMY
jgi:hypothetical protein